MVDLPLIHMPALSLRINDQEVAIDCLRFAYSRPSALKSCGLLVKHSIYTCVGVCISMLNGEVKVGGLAQASSVVGGAPAVTSKNPCPTSSSARASNAHGPANTSILHSPTLFSHSPHRAAKPPSLLPGHERNDKG